MFNRYGKDTIQLDPGERVGWQFVTCAQEIHTELMRLQDGKRMAAQLKIMDDAGNELGKLLGEYESIRSVFKVPQQLRDDYSSAYRRYQNLKKNPDVFHAQEQIKRQELENEQKILADKIPQQEVALARGEDERRYQAANERKRLAHQAEALRNQILKYQRRSGTFLAKSFAGYNKKNRQQIERAQAELKQVEQALENVGNIKKFDMDDLRYQLDLLRKRRWEVEKEIHVYDDNPEQRIKRWEAAVDDAQIQMYIRQIETDHAIDRFYGRFSQQLMHAFLNVYAMLRDCLSVLQSEGHQVTEKISALTEAAGKIYCPELANRSIVTLYKKNQPNADLVDSAVPDLSLRRGDDTFSFAVNSLRRHDSEADDLPDITPELMKKLDTMWDDDVHDQPVQRLVIALREHMDSINPYMETLRDSNQAWHECWKFLYTIAQQLDLAAQNDISNKYYSIPEKLKLEEIRARLDLGKTEIDWAAAKARHFDKLDQIQREILDLAEKLKIVKEADDLAMLAKYELNPVDSDKPNVTTRKPGCFSVFYTMFARKQRRPVVKTEEKNDPAALQSMRDRLIREYEDQIRAKTNLYNTVGENIPVKPEKYRDAWNMAKAKMLHGKMDYYRCQGKEVMLHCLRLYILASRTFYLTYGEHPLVATGQPIPVAMAVSVLKDGSDHLVLKAKTLFRQMVRGLKCQFDKYYCLQPDRYEFTQYLDHYNSINQAEVRDAILAGVADEKMLEKVFREYEAPEEAFALPQHEVRRRA